MTGSMSLIFLLSQAPIRLGKALSPILSLFLNFDILFIMDILH